jgi:dUTP pyrophosphatase
MIELKVYKTHPNIKLPVHATKGSACFDLAFQIAGKGSVKVYTSMNKPVNRTVNKSLTIGPGDRALVPTGMIFDIPEGYSVRVHARSGTALKQGLVMANAEGVIDSDYIEETFIMVHNISQNSITINDGDRIAQAELVKNVEYEIEQTALRPLPKTMRAGGFGSTGVSTISQLKDLGGSVIINIPDIKTTIVEECVLDNIDARDILEDKPKRGRGRPKKSATAPPRHG